MVYSRDSLRIEYGTFDKFDSRVTARETRSAGKVAEGVFLRVSKSAKWLAGGNRCNARRDSRGRGLGCLPLEGKLNISYPE